ncbi:hypothetical protein LY76DRAFT_66218 [Colletotrichum caudatum]|nr:hypothetical protein LY76DRAFT_66218 [Colletotrichum caudatum]
MMRGFEENVAFFTLTDTNYGHRKIISTSGRSGMLLDTLRGETVAPCCWLHVVGDTQVSLMIGNQRSPGVALAPSCYELRDLADQEASGSKRWAHGPIVWALCKETSLVRPTADRHEPPDPSPSVQPRDQRDTRSEATYPAYARREAAEITQMGHARGPLPWSS